MKNLYILMKYLKNYKTRISFSVISMLLQVATGFMIPYLMIRIIDDAIKNQNQQLLFETAGLMLLTAVVGLITGLINNYNSQYISQYAGADMRLGLFTKIQNLSFSNIDKLKTSRLITSSTNDIVRVQTFFQMLFRIVLRAPLMVGFGVYMAIETSAGLSQVFYFSVPLLVITIVTIMIIAFPKFQKVQKTVDNLNKVTLENVNAPRVIKSFVTTEYENKKFEAANEDFRKTNTSAEKVMAFAEPMIQFIFNATLAGIIFIGAIIIKDGGLMGTLDSGEVAPQIGVLMAFSSYSMQILFGLMMFAMMMIFISRAEVSAKRINEIFDEDADVINDSEFTQDISGKLEFKNVDFAYGSNEYNVLTNLSFVINPGETVGIIGSTGSGKTSLINLVPRLYDVTSGEILVDGVNVKDYDLSNLRSQISVVTQQATIFSGSIGTNIMQGKPDAEFTDYEKSSKLADAYEFISEYDDLFNHEIQQGGSNLSGGQKQRLSLTRAFIRNPKILILDDSTSAVDAKSEEFILNSIKELSSNLTTLVISQKVSTIKDMDKILVLNNKGKLDGFGTHEELLKESKVYYEIALSQVGNGGDSDE